MPAMIRPEDLLDGPRGRRLCLSAAIALEPAIQPLLPMFASEPLSPEVRRDLAAAVADVDPGPLARETDELRMLEPLASAVDAARYWQPPDEDDAITETPEVRDALRPIAEALLATPAAAWWATGLADGQRFVEWGDAPAARLDLSPAREKLEKWRAAALAAEVEAASRPSSPAAPWSGPWWSSPADAGLPRTRRALDGLGSAELALEEDGFGEEEARVIPVVARGGVRVFEILAPEDWVALVAKYPLDVSLSRRHDWWRITGLDGTWLAPDWEAVARDVDVVHLSVNGYLATAGRALAVGPSHTVLAGWNADESFWLTDVLERDGEPVTWQRSADRPAAWTPVGMAG